MTQVTSLSLYQKLPIRLQMIILGKLFPEAERTGIQKKLLASRLVELMQSNHAIIDKVFSNLPKLREKNNRRILAVVEKEISRIFEPAVNILYKEIFFKIIECPKLTNEMLIKLIEYEKNPCVVIVMKVAEWIGVFDQGRKTQLGESLKKRLEDQKFRKKVVQKLQHQNDFKRAMEWLKIQSSESAIDVLEKSMQEFAKLKEDPILAVANKHLSEFKKPVFAAILSQFDPEKNLKDPHLHLG